MRTYVYIFVAAFLLNAFWEHIHALLYVHYKSGPITEFILFRAAFFDAAIITIVALACFMFLPKKYVPWCMAVFLVLFAVGLELWALGAGRWAYTEAMPLVPFLGTGITPTIQLGLLGYLSVLISQASQIHITHAK